MPRRASLEPKPTTKAHAPWVVNLPPSLSSNGGRERRYFDSKKVADEFCRLQRIRLENYGTASTILPAGKVEEAAAAFDRLKGTGASLTEAVDQFLKWRAKRASSITFAVLLEKFAKAKEKRSKPYLKQIAQATTRATPLHAKLVEDITPDELEALLLGGTDNDRNHFLSVIRAAYNLGIKKEWCDPEMKNPVLRMDFARLNRQTSMLTNAEVAALLTASVTTDLSVLPYLLLTIFAGVRPDEVGRTMWANVNMVEHYVEVPDKKSKTGVRRIVEMEPVLVRWFRYYKARGGSTKGKVAAPNLRRRLREIRKAAGLADWPEDAPRRTYASCWLAVFNDVNALCLRLGHTTPKMLFQHYFKAVTKKDAIAFWKIEPPGVPKAAQPARARRPKTDAVELMAA